MQRKRSAPTDLGMAAPYAAMVREYRRQEKKIKREQDEIPAVKLENILSPLSPRDPTPEPEIRAQHNCQSSSDDEEIEFEDIDLDNSDASEDEAPLEDVTVQLDSRRATHLTRNKTKTMKKPQRLVIHKLGLIAWALHAHMRNKWLANPELLEALRERSILTDSVRQEICSSATLTPFLRSKKLVDGLEHAMEEWRTKFSVSNPGLASFGQTCGDNILDYYQFREKLLSLKGSADLMGQGYVALIRSLGLETRLVCSFQPPDNLQVESTQKLQRGESNCPLFWAEVWDQFAEKWIVIDPLTGTVRLPTRAKVKLKIEPPQNDSANILRYCWAYDSQGYVRDVTRRYAYSYNARTRKKRLPYVESPEWLETLLSKFSKHRFTSNDVAELRELARYPQLEGIPTRVQDFVGHPEYALESQLHRNEVLREGSKPIGVLANKVKSKSVKLGPPQYIFARSDVLTARSAPSWYKQGRELEIGAQPVAHRPMKNRLTGETEHIALYLYDQTKPYVPEPVGEDNVVPKSVYRTVDLFTPEMCPPGARHIPEKTAAAAAKILGIDYANAVVDIEYGKSGAQSKILGIVVANAYVPAVYSVLQGLQEIEQVRLNRLNTIRILKLWRQFIMGVQIRERVEGMNPDRNEGNEVKSEIKTLTSNGTPPLNTPSPNTPSPSTPSPNQCRGPRLRRNFAALLRATLIRPPNYSSMVVDADAVARLKARMLHVATSPEASPDILESEPKLVVPQEIYSSDSFSDMDNEEISESDL